MSEDCCTCIVYATIDDFDQCGVPPNAIAGTRITLQVKQKALLRASRVADTYLRDRYHLPLLTPIDPALNEWTVWLAAWQLMSFRGFNPNTGQIDAVVRMNYDDTIKALVRVANGQQQLCVRQAVPESLQPELATSPSRGFAAPDGAGLPFVGPNTWGS